MLNRKFSNVKAGRAGTLSGTYGEYQFLAKVLDKPNRLCINHGRVLRLVIQSSAAGEIAVYDRGWEYIPIDVTLPIYRAIWQFCDSWKGQVKND